MSKHVLIYGANETTSALLEAARVAAFHAYRYGSTVMVADRYGVEAEVMNACRTDDAPLLVVGTTVRPSSGVSMRFYERALVDAKRREIDLRKYLMRKAFRVVVIGNSPDCKAMVVYARVSKKPVAHYANGLPSITPVRVGPDHQWFSNLKHDYTLENLIRYQQQHPSPN